jgi:hypothetical protein
VTVVVEAVVVVRTGTTTALTLGLENASNIEERIAYRCMESL